MIKEFNVNEACNPKKHYMVDLIPRMKQIKKMVDKGKYFTITKDRQYGKTTTLKCLNRFLEKDYEVVFLDFQELGYASFVDEASFTSAVARLLLFVKDSFPDDIKNELEM